MKNNYPRKVKFRKISKFQVPSFVQDPLSFNAEIILLAH